MNIYTIVDDNFGMLFNSRRQSKDRVLREHMLRECEDTTLWMNTYSSDQFELPLPGNVIVDDDFLDKAGEDDACFVENLPLTGFESRINKMFLFKWNRIYPADTWLDVRPGGRGWQLAAVEEFEGNSHEKITKEEWVHVEEE